MAAYGVTASRYSIDLRRGPHPQAPDHRGQRTSQGIALDLVNDEILVANSAFQTANGGSILAFRRTDAGIVVPAPKLEGAHSFVIDEASPSIIAGERDRRGEREFWWRIVRPVGDDLQ